MHELTISLPTWVHDRVDYTHPYEDDESRMRLAIRLSRENLEQGTGARSFHLLRPLSDVPRRCLLEWDHAAGERG